MAAEGIILQQTIHGYRSGHELLRTSTSLPSQAQRTMLVQSDLSGPGATGFEQYISGYPIESIGAYALARTWYAPEMDRPGCVWTHSLLIEFSDLALLPSLGEIAIAFKRPNRELSYSSEILPALEFRRAASAKPLVQTDSETMRRVLAALYSQPSRSVVEFAHNSLSAEPLVFGVWTQQWPRLRRAFRFCTGAVAARTQDSIPFDLLVAPQALRSRIQREMIDAVFVDEIDEPVDAGWLAMGVAGLRGEEPRLKEFLWLYGADVVAPRAAWRGLVESFALLQRTGNETDLVQTINDCFSATGDAKRLKADLLGIDAKLRQPNVDLPSLLISLGTLQSPTAFADEDVDASGLVEQVWRDERSAGLRLLKELLERSLNVHGERMLEAALKEVGPSAAMDLERLKPGIMSTLVARVPRLATDSSVWLISIDRQRELLQVLSAKGIEPVLAALAVVVRAGSDSLVADVEHLCGDDAASRILELASDDDSFTERVRNTRWSELLHRRSLSVLAWLLMPVNRTPTQTQFALDHLDPRWQETRAAPIDAWIPLALTMDSQVLSQESIRGSAFLLSLSLADDSPASATVISLTFAKVFAAAARYALAEDWWEWMSADLPSKSWYRSWDKCERLCRGVVQRFLRQRWPLMAFLRAASDPEALKQAIDVARDERETRGFVDRIEREYRRGDLHVTSAQRDLLDDLL